MICTSSYVSAKGHIRGVLQKVSIFRSSAPSEIATLTIPSSMSLYIMGLATYLRHALSEALVLSLRMLSAHNVTASLE